MNGERPPGDARPRRQGWVGRLLARLLLPTVRDEVQAGIVALRGELVARDLQTAEAVATAVSSHSASIEELRDDVAKKAVDHKAAIEELRDDVAKKAVDHDAGFEELRGHLEARLDNLLGELGDARGALLAVRGDLEHLRDEVFPRTEERPGGLVTGLRALGDRISGVGRALQHEVEILRDERVPRAERDLGRLQSGLEAVQSDLAGVRDLRVARVEATLDETAATARALQEELIGLRDGRLPTVETDVGRQQRAMEQLQAELAEVRDARVGRSEADLARVSGAVTALQADIELLRDERVARVERDLDRLQGAQQALQSLAEELRDGRVPALSGRIDALIGRLHEEVTATGGMLERVLAREPLGVGASTGVEEAIPEAVRAASARFAEAMRGPRREILGRARDCLPYLIGHEPVLDLGCGRGELLEVLRDEGVEARGVDADRAMVAACRRRGLTVELEDVVAALRGVAPESLGAVTAVHVVEHLPAGAWMSLVEAAAVALRPGGMLLVESPNPETLRVGGGLFWVDPTHRAPVHPLAVGLVAEAVGLEVAETKLLRPFPADQSLLQADQSEPLRRLAARLDEWLSGPRDFLFVARKRG